MNILTSYATLNMQNQINFLSYDKHHYSKNSNIFLKCTLNPDDYEKREMKLSKRVKPKIDLNVLFTVLLSRFPSFVNISLYLFKTSKVAAVILLCYMTLQCKQNKMFLIIPISHRRQLQPPNLPTFISIDIKSLVFVSNFKYLSCIQ